MFQSAIPPALSALQLLVKNKLLSPSGLREAQTGMTVAMTHDGDRESFSVASSDYNVPRMWLIFADPSLFNSIYLISGNCARQPFLFLNLNASFANKMQWTTRVVGRRDLGHNLSQQI